MLLSEFEELVSEDNVARRTGSEFGDDDSLDDVGIGFMRSDKSKGSKLALGRQHLDDSSSSEPYDYIDEKYLEDDDYYFTNEYGEEEPDDYDDTTSEELIGGVPRYDMAYGGESSDNESDHYLTSSRSDILNRRRRAVSNTRSTARSKATSDVDDEDEIDLMKSLVHRFPQQRLKRQQELDSIKSLAMHRMENLDKNEYNTKLRIERERDKRRFRKAYESILDEERRETRIKEQKRLLATRLEQKRQEHERRVEQTRIKRLAEEMARESESRRQRRKDKEDALVRGLFSEALATEKQRVLRATAIATEERAREDREALARYEAARKVYDDQREILEEKLKEQEKIEKTQKRERQDQLRKLSRELKHDFEQKLEQARVSLEAQEEQIFQVNSDLIEKAFTILNDSRAAWYAIAS
jgi:hypothetical protein